MKKLLTFTLTLLLIFVLTSLEKPVFAITESSSNSIVLKIGSNIMSVNGIEQEIDSKPIIENGVTLVPIRAIFEALSAEIDWDPNTKTVIGTRGNVEIQLKIGSYEVSRNNRTLWLQAAPKIINNRTMVPLRFIAESFGSDVQWDEKTRTIYITDIKQFIKLNDITISIGDKLEQVEELLGKADRIDPSTYDFKWHVYNSDYSKFIMVGIKNNIVEALYSNAKSFETNLANYGDSSVKSEKGQTFYVDKHDDNKIYACYIVSSNVTAIDEYYDEIFKAQELENFDATNAYRVSHGLKALKIDDIAALTARKHSQDMADNNFFDHTNQDGLSPWDRYKSNNGKNFGSGENIAANSSTPSGVYMLNMWVNSLGHRNNMLSDHKYLGVGLGYNMSSSYKYYMTQFFSK